MNHEVIARAYVAFNARDIDGALAAMQPDVTWPNGMEGGFVVGHDAVRAYWTRQWSLIDPHVSPIASTRRSDGRIAVQVHQVVRDLGGTVLTDRMVHHVYTLADDLVAAMEIEE